MTNEQILKLIDYCLAEKDPIKAIGIALGDSGPGTVVGKMVELDFLLLLEQSKTGFTASFIKSYGAPTMHVPLSNVGTTRFKPAAAICEAAYKALMEKNNGNA